MRECEALGLLEITQRGIAGNAEFCSPNYFRLTYLPTMATTPATHDWRRIEAIESAKALIRAARAPVKPPARPSRKTHRQPESIQQKELDYDCFSRAVL
jgi:hypothetical protein